MVDGDFGAVLDDDFVAEAEEFVADFGGVDFFFVKFDEEFEAGAYLFAGDDKMFAGEFFVGGNDFDVGFRGIGTTAHDVIALIEGVGFPEVVSRRYGREADPAPATTVPPGTPPPPSLVDGLGVMSLGSRY